MRKYALVFLTLFFGCFTVFYAQNSGLIDQLESDTIFSDEIDYHDTWAYERETYFLESDGIYTDTLMVSCRGNFNKTWQFGVDAPGGEKAMQMNRSETKWGGWVISLFDMNPGTFLPEFERKQLQEGNRAIAMDVYFEETDEEYTFDTISLNSNNGEGVRFQMRLVKASEFDDNHHFLLKEATLTEPGTWQTLVFNTDDVVEMAGKTMVPEMDSIDRIMLLPAAGFSKADSNLIYIRNMRIVDAAKNGGEAPDYEKPSVPKQLSGIADGKTITLEWNSASDNIGVVKYKVYSGDGTVLGATGDTTMVYEGLAYETTYTFIVTALDGAGNESGKSNMVEVTTGLAPEDTEAPDAPTGLSYVEILKQYKFTWNASSDNFGVTGYNVYMDDQVVATVSENEYSFTDYSPGNTYTFKVTALDLAGNESAASNEVTIDVPTGLNKVSSELLSVYPNPVENAMIITSVKWMREISVYNVTGKEISVHYMNSRQSTIDMSELESGMYLIKVVYRDDSRGMLQVIKK